MRKYIGVLSLIILAIVTSIVTSKLTKADRVKQKHSSGSNVRPEMAPFFISNSVADEVKMIQFFQHDDIVQFWAEAHLVQSRPTMDYVWCTRIIDENKNKIHERIYNEQRFHTFKITEPSIEDKINITLKPGKYYFQVLIFEMSGRKNIGIYTYISHGFTK